MKVTVSKGFERAYRKLSKVKQADADKAIRGLFTDPMPAALRLRTLKGSADLWIASIDKGDRIIGRMVAADSLELLDVGEHDATYRKWNRRK